MIDDLVQFLRDRLDEDERIAKAAGGAPWEASVPGMVHVSAPAQRETRGLRAQGYVAVVEHAERQQHIARHGPARVLADVDAKRRIIDRAAGTRAWAIGESGRSAGPAVSLANDTLRALALPYADHPAYRQEWKS